jgi:hypothetical protein
MPGTLADILKINDLAFKARKEFFLRDDAAVKIQDADFVIQHQWA